MDTTTKERLADMICGDDTEVFPIYRSSMYLTEFFQDIKLDYTHDGSTRKWWVLEVLQKLKNPDLQKIVLRLASPKLYSGIKQDIQKGLQAVNEIIAMEGLKVKLKGVEPFLVKEGPDFNIEDETSDLKPLTAPEFDMLNLPTGLDKVLEKRWEEIQKCIDGDACTASVILMGSLLEGFLLGIMLQYPELANDARNAPIYKNKKIKKFPDWSLSEMIDVAYTIGWIELDVKKFSHVLREFRNIIHPHEQLKNNNYPNIDTCNISWLVVQAACNDIAGWQLACKE